MYVLRYIGSIDARRAPSAVVTPASGHESDLMIISGPGRALGELASPGASVVVLVERAAVIEITVSSIAGSENLDARFGLEMLDTGVEERTGIESQASRHDKIAVKDFNRRASPQVASTGMTMDAPLLRLTAHVSRRGDVEADEQGWVGGPRTPSAIEGIGIESGAAAVGVMAQVKTAAQRLQWSDWYDPGVFVGSRQQATPITALRLRVVGAEAAQYELVARALFLGSPLIEERGRDIELLGGAASDPLVGLSLSFVPVVQTSAKPKEALRVRVYR